MLSDGVIVKVLLTLFEYPVLMGPAGPPSSLTFKKSPLFNVFEQLPKNGKSEFCVDVVDVIPKSSIYLSFLPLDLTSTNLIKTLVRPRDPIFKVYWVYIMDPPPAGKLTLPLVVHDVVPLGDVWILNAQALSLPLLLCQKVKTPGFAICGVLIASLAPSKVKLYVPVLTGDVLYKVVLTFVAVQVPPCVGNVLVKLS